jgi:hypothetical protein
MQIEVQYLSSSEIPRAQELLNAQDGCQLSSSSSSYHHTSLTYGSSSSSSLAYGSLSSHISSSSYQKQ